jgi:two-component system sensor histidine kinase ChiS
MLKYFHFSLSEKIPLKTVIIVPFVLQIVAAVGLTGWLSFRNGQKAINDLVTQLQSEITERIYQHLTTHTSMAHTANQINADSIHLGLLDLTDRKGLERHFWKQVQDLETVSYAGLGTPQATYVGAQALKDNSTLIEISDSTTANHLQIWNSNKVGERTELTKNSPNYDPRKRPWYQAALKAKEAVWTDIYFSSRRTTLSANQPVYEDEEKKKNLLAVVTADLTLVEIGKFLRSLNLGNGQSLIIERSGLMVATSTNEKPYRITKAFQQQTEQIDSLSPERRYSERQNKVERFKAIDSQNVLTRAIASFLNQHFGDLATIKNAEITFFYLNNEKYFLQIKPFADGRGLDWLIVVVAPEADFIEPINTNFYIMLILGLIALVIASWVGIATAKWIVEPLWCLNLAASALARGEWQQQIAMEREDEVGELAHSFNRMSKQLQELFTTLEAKNADLERLDKLKDEFLANTSHELRTPLNGIIGLAESLIDGATGRLSESTRSNLSMIVASGRRLSNLVNDILDFSKQKQNAIELDWQPVNLRIVTDMVLKICQPLVGQKPVQLINAIPPELPFAYADENRIQQILHNLIGNAIKFTEKGSVDISAQLIEKSLKDSSISQEESTSEKKLTDETEMTKKTEQSLAHAQLVITVSDTGIGIPSNQTQKIFESFEQIAEAQTPSHHGTGLGLVVTQQLIALHGGTIWVDSVEGQGSRFSFTLQVAHPSALSTDSEAATATTLPSRAITESQSHKQFPSYHQLLVESSTQEFKTTSLTTETVARTAQEVNVLEDTLLNYREDSKKLALFEQKTIKNAENAESEEQSNFTILIVDDEPVNLHVLANHLSLYNYVILRASSGSDALATLEKGITPDLILLDVMMPHMTGYEVTQKIRERWEAYELPILLLTAKNQVADLVTGLEVGANDYLIKPISKNELLARIKTHLRIKELKEETLRLVIESERRLTQFLEAVPVGVFVTDANGHPYYANQKAQQLLGQGVKKRNAD